MHNVHQTMLCKLCCCCFFDLNAMNAMNVLILHFMHFCTVWMHHHRLTTADRWRKDTAENQNHHHFVILACSSSFAFMPFELLLGFIFLTRLFRFEWTIKYWNYLINRIFYLSVVEHTHTHIHNTWNLIIGLIKKEMCVCSHSHVPRKYFFLLGWTFVLASS